MCGYIKYFLVLLIHIFFIVNFATAQVTFSKGWGPGKRTNLYDDECRINAKSLALLFHTIMDEIKHLMTCDHQATINYLQSVEH